MKTLHVFSSLMVAAIVIARSEAAATIAIAPVDDASIYTCDGCVGVSDFGPLMIVGYNYIQAVLKFPTSPIKGKITSAVLKLTPYATPLFGPGIDVSGQGSLDAEIQSTDANAGSLLGQIPLSGTVQDASPLMFDLTKFVADVNAPFVQINLRSNGSQTFTSLETNYGPPSQLIVTTVPEPSTAALLVIGCVVGLVARRR